ESDSTRLPSIGDRGDMAKKSARKERKPPPKCKAILPCDYTIVEAETDKVSVIGILDSWTFPQFPHSTPPFKVFLQLTDGIGNYIISAEVRDLQADQIITQGRVAEIDFPERKSKHDLIISVPPLSLQHAGSYD